VKNITTAMITDAGKNRDDSYPSPSIIDANNRTVTIAGASGREGDSGAAKDNLGNLMSYLIYINALVPEVCVSPTEFNALVSVDTAYQNALPALASVPAEALWDPGFAGTPIDSGLGVGKGRRTLAVGGQEVAPGNVSYATTLFANVRGNTKRVATWKANNSASQAIVSGRGPSYVEDATPALGTWTLVPAGELGGQFKGPGMDSTALLNPIARGKFIGPIGYNDGSVSSEQVPDPPQISMQSTVAIGGSNVVRDNIFVNELNDASRAARAGREDWRAGTNILLMPVAAVGPGDGVSVPPLVVWRD
jgi:hypothetical protein